MKGIGKLLALTLAGAFFASILYADEAVVRMPYQATYWVQPGDTLLSIGGSSFMEIFKRNISTLQEMDPKGPNPNRIIEGTQLIVPQGAYVTEKVARAINGQETTQNTAWKAIAAAERSQRQLKRAGYTDQEGYQKGSGLLLQARGLASQRPGYGNANFLQAYELAVEAERYFDTDIALSRVHLDLDKLKEKIGDIKHSIVKGLRDSRPLYLTALAMLLATMLTGLAYAKVKSKDKRKKYVQQRLLQHKTQLQAYLNGNF